MFKEVVEDDKDSQRTPSICKSSERAVEFGPRNFAQRATSHSMHDENGAHSLGTSSD
jgi:hypothetical protein